MRMFNPPHPGEFIQEVYLEPFGISTHVVADKMKVLPSTLNGLLDGQIDVSSEIALRLSKTLGRSAESWLAMQSNYNLWHARQKVSLDEVEPLVIDEEEVLHSQF